MKKLLIVWAMALLACASYAQVGGPGTVMVPGGGGAPVESVNLLKSTNNIHNIQANTGGLAISSVISSGGGFVWSNEGDGTSSIFKLGAGNIFGIDIDGDDDNDLSFSSSGGLVLGAAFLGTVMKLSPQASPPVTCNAGNAGYIYSDTSLALCFCDATSWQVLNPLTVGVGACA